MRTQIIALAAALIISITAGAQTPDRQVNIPFSSAPLQDVLAHLKTYGLKFSYSNEQVPLGKKIVLNQGFNPLYQLLQNICTQTGLEYHITSDQIVLRTKTRPETFTITGRVLAGNDRPVSSVSIILQGTPRGTITDYDGRFSMAIDAGKLPATLVFTCIGYKNQKATITTPTPEKLLIQLDADEVQLPTVEVHAKTGLAVLQEALARISENYDTGAVRYTLFVRDLTETDGTDPIGVSEAVHQAYRNASPAQTRQVSYVKGRRNKDYATYQQILTTFPRWTGFDLWADINLIFTEDLALPPKDDQFPSKKFIQQHNFELLGISRLGGREVYIIDFDQKDNIRKSLYTGKIHIDVETLAFIRVETRLSPKGLKYARFFGSSRAMAYIFGYAECRIQNVSTITDYTPYNGKWYIRAIHIDAAFTVAKTRKDLYMDLHLQGDIVVTHMNLEDPRPMPANTVMTPQDFRYRHYLYNNAFWNGYTTLPTNHATEEAFVTIADKNRRTPFDTNFWKRFQPYKGNPALLHHTDSLQQTSPPVAEPTSEAYSTSSRKARYEPLTRTHHTAHFILAHTPADSLTATTMAQLLEDNYARILADFSLATLPEPLLVEIYPSIEDYHFAIGNTDAPPSDAGMATGNTTFKIVSPHNPGPYHTTESLMRASIHEFAHCVHYCYIATRTDNTRNELIQHPENPWLFEALATYEANQFYNPTRFAYLKDSKYPTLQELNDVNSNGKIYDIGFILIDYILKTYGKEKLLRLVQTNGNITEAFKKTETTFEKEFYHYLEQTYKP